MEVIIELISRNNKVQSLHKLSGDTITIGRAYDNDLVLQEEHTSPYHVEIIQSESGGLLLIDQDSINGIRDRKNKKLDSQVSLNSGDVVTIGKHLIRVILPNHPVENAKRLNIFEDITRHLNQWYLALFSAFLFFISMLIKSYFTSVTEIIWSKQFATALLVTIALMLVPLLISLSARVFKKEVKFFTAIVFSFAMFVAWQCTTAVGQVILFNWGNTGLVVLGADVIEFVLMVTFFWGCFYLASNMNLKRISIVSSLLVISIASLFHFSAQDNGKVQLYPMHYAVVLPSGMLVSRPISTAEYIESTDELFDSALKEAEKRNKDADEQQ
jgi:hypothetical protein